MVKFLYSKKTPIALAFKMVQSHNCPSAILTHWRLTSEQNSHLFSCEPAVCVSARHLYLKRPHSGKQLVLKWSIIVKSAIFWNVTVFNKENTWIQYYLIRKRAIFWNAFLLILNTTILIIILFYWNKSAVFEIIMSVLRIKLT